MASDNSAGGAGFDWGQLFSGIENTAVQITRTISAPTGTQYVPQTGTYQSIPGTVSAATASLTSNAGILLLVGFGLVAILLLKK